MRRWRRCDAAARAARATELDVGHLEYRGPAQPVAIDGLVEKPDLYVTFRKA